MRAKTMILFVIAVGCGLVASIGVSQYLENASGNSGVSVETAKIFVAMADIGIGKKLDATNVKLEEWPRDRVPEGAINDLKDLEGRYPRQRLYHGEPVLKAKLMDSNDGSNSVDIPEGYRVVSTKVSMDSAVSGLLQPGDRVDILVFFRKGAEVPDTGTKTILRDVNVFAVDSETERRVDSEGEARNLRTVSLLVKPAQAEAVKLADQLGTLSLTLRRPEDTLEETSEGMTIQELLGNAGENANENSKQPKSDPGPSSFVQMLANAAVSAAPVVIPTPAETRPAWVMKVMTADGHREYRWDDPDELPSEVGAGASLPAAGPVSIPSTFSPPADPGSGGSVRLPPIVDLVAPQGEPASGDGTTKEPLDAN